MSDGRPRTSPPARNERPTSLFDALPQALRAMRGDRSQAEMAELCGKAQSWWSNLESGKRNPRLPDLIPLSRNGLSLVAGGWTVADAAPPHFDPTDARNALTAEKKLLDLLSWVPGWSVMERREIDRILNECEALRVERDAAREAIDEAYDALANGDTMAARLTLSANRVEAFGVE